MLYFVGGGVDGTEVSSPDVVEEVSLFFARCILMLGIWLMLERGEKSRDFPEKMK